MSSDACCSSLATGTMKVARSALHLPLALWERAGVRALASRPAPKGGDRAAAPSISPAVSLRPAQRCRRTRGPATRTLCPSGAVDLPLPLADLPVSEGLQTLMGPSQPRSAQSGVPVGLSPCARQISCASQNRAAGPQSALLGGRGDCPAASSREQALVRDSVPWSPVPAQLPPKSTCSRLRGEPHCVSAVSAAGQPTTARYERQRPPAHQQRLRARSGGLGLASPLLPVFPQRNSLAVRRRSGADGGGTRRFVLFFAPATEIGRGSPGMAAERSCTGTVVW
jgi:hypothetical protein